MIDWNRVKELFEDVGCDDFDEVAMLFLAEVQDRIDQLTAADTRTDLEADLHFLKGSALSLGFSAFADLCQTGERAAASGLGDRVDLDVIVATFEQSRMEFAAQRAAKLAA